MTKSEKLTRKEIIDHQLKQADWDISDWTQVIEEFDIVVDVNLTGKTDTIKSQYQSSLQQLENLDGCLSQRAFRGELKNY